MTTKVTDKGIIYPDGTEQTTAAFGSGGGVEAQPPVAFSMSGGSGTQSIPENTSTLVEFESADVDTDLGVDLDKNIYVVKHDGLMHINAHAIPSCNTNDLQVAILDLKLDGEIKATDYLNTFTSFVASNSVSVSQILTVKKGQEISVEVKVIQSNPANNSIILTKEYSTLSGHMVSSITEGEVKEKEAVVFRGEVSQYLPQSVTPSVFTDIELTPQSDTTNSWDNTNNHFKPSVAGYYQVNAKASDYGGGADAIAIARINKNGGSEIIDGAQNNTSTVSGIFYLDGVDDNLSLVVRNSTGNKIVADFSVHLITGQSSGGSGGGELGNAYLVADDCIYLNKQEIINDYTMPSGYNGMTAGPVNSSGDIFIPEGSEWSIVGTGGGGSVDAYTKAETDTKLNGKANKSDTYTKAMVYTKTESDSLFGGSGGSVDAYTKSETNTLLDNKANVGDSYNKSESYNATEVDGKLFGKANTGVSYTKAETYSKAEVDAIKSNSAYVNVKDFGAIGNGSANDSTAIQNAINSIESGTVYLPSGSYKINTGIILRAGVALIASTGRQTALIAGSDNIDMLSYTNTSGATTTGFSISGFQISSGGRSGVGGIKIFGKDNAIRVSDVILSDLQFVNLKFGISLFLTANSFISGIFSSNCTDGIIINRCADTSLVNCKVQNGSGIGYQILGDGGATGGGGNASDEGTEIVNCTTNGQKKGILVDGADWGQVTNCSFTTAHDGAVISSGKSTNWKFTSCHITSNQYPLAPKTAGAELSTESKWFSFSNCFFALSTFGLVGRGDYLVVNGCTFDVNNNVDIYLLGTNNAISGNLISNGSVPNCIVEAASANRSNVTGNVCNRGIALQGSNSIQSNNITS